MVCCGAGIVTVTTFSTSWSLRRAAAAQKYWLRFAVGAGFGLGFNGSAAFRFGLYVEFLGKRHLKPPSC